MTGSAAAQAKRYARQIALKSVGVSGQQKLLKSAVAVPGLDSAASLAARYLVAAGVGCCFTDACEAGALEALNPQPVVAPLAEAGSSTPRARARASHLTQLRALTGNEPPLPELLGALAATEALLTLLQLAPPPETLQASTP